MDVIWVAVLRGEHGGETVMEGVYGSRDAAVAGLGKLPNMQAFVGSDGLVHGEPIRRRHPGERSTGAWFPVQRALARPVPVRRHVPLALLR